MALRLHSHRTTKLNKELQLQRLRGFITPVQQSWDNLQLTHAASSFEGFCDLLGLSQVSPYLVSRKVHEIQEWGLYQLDSEGQAIQKELEEHVKVICIAFLALICSYL